MNDPGSEEHREEVMYQFAVEADHDRETLMRYLRAHPGYAGELLDLHRDLTLEAVEDAPADDPLVDLSTAEQRLVARAMGLPRQVLSALRERRVVLQSIPPGFLERLAEALGATVDALTVALAAPMASSTTRSYRADEAPAAPTRVTFEQLLIDARVPDAERRAFLDDLR